MTKTKLGQSDAKPSEYSSTPLYSSVQVIDGEQPQEQVSDYNLLATAVFVTEIERVWLYVVINNLQYYYNLLASVNMQVHLCKCIYNSPLFDIDKSGFCTIHSSSLQNMGKQCNELTVHNDLNISKLVQLQWTFFI